MWSDGWSPTWRVRLVDRRRAVDDETGGEGTMRAAWYERQGPAQDVLVVGEMETPEPGSGEVRVRLRTSGVTELERSRVTLWPPVPCEALTALQGAAVWVEPDFTILRQLLHGEIDAIVACAGGPWDHAPAVILTEEAGGRFRDHHGGRRLDLGGGVYTNGHIDDALAQVLSCSGPWDPSPTDRSGGG